MENRKEIMRLANEIEKIKAKAKLGRGYKFDVKPHQRDSEKWVHAFKTDCLTREWIKELIKEIWELYKEDAYREVKVGFDCGEGRSPLPLPTGKLIRKACPDGF
jgi:uncharacterized coiled-coil DUF342 family protein